MATYKRQRYLLMTTDPVHIGAGGYRLGRVDNSIVREPGARVPKIPGTSLHGAARSYAAQLYETPEAAGQSQDNVAHPDQNPVCYTFGYIKKMGNGKDVKSYSGVVNMFDAHILLFPVHSMVGPVWVSTVARLQEAGFTIEDVPEQWDIGAALLTWQRNDALNLGWLMVNVAGSTTVTAPSKWQKTDYWKAVVNHVALVQEALFSHVVNSNLEVRTSVAIDPKRGAAEDKALFTYEAIPRATFLTAEVVLDDYRSAFPSQQYLNSRDQEITNQLQKGPLPQDQRQSLEREQDAIRKELRHIEQLKTENAKRWKEPLDVVQSGLRMIEWLGVGGMGTRGFGRLAIVGEPLEQAYGEEEWK